MANEPERVVPHTPPEIPDDEDVEIADPMWNPALQMIPVSGIRRIVNKAAKMDDVIHLSIGQPDFPTPRHIIDAYVAALLEGKTGYTLDAGLPELLAVIARYYSERYGREIVGENVLVTSGATEAVYLALTALAAPGREFILSDPTFILYAPLIRMNGGIVTKVPTRTENGHQLDPEEVISMIGPQTYAIVLNSPNNPTGAVYPPETMNLIAREAAYRNLFLVCDEVYDHLVLDDMEYPSILRSAADIDNVMCISGVSKTYSMAGLRIGWVIASQATIKRLRRFHMFTTTVANTPAQWATVAALTGDKTCIDEMVAEYRRRRDRVVQLVGDTPELTGYWPQGAFYIFPSLPPNTDATRVAYRMLEEIRVCTIPGEAFGISCPNSLRISYSTSMENIEEAFSRMIPWLAKEPY